MSEIEVNKIKPATGTTVTLGDSGDSIDITSGATVTNFKSTGIDDNADATAITIDSSENVGIGETSPLGKLHVKSADSGATVNAAVDEIVVENSGDAGITILTGTTNTGGVMFGDSGNNYMGGMIYQHNGNNLVFKGNGSDRMIIGSTGKVSVGDSVPYSGGSVNGVQLHSGPPIQCSRDSTASRAQIEFQNPNGSVGTITTSSSSTAYNTSSDYRLKENVIDLADATTRVKQLQPKRFNFIADADNTVDGFLAHEVSSVVPEAITGTHNEVDDDGNPVYQGIDQSKLVPLLTASLQEALTEIDNLKARIEALENA